MVDSKLATNGMPLEMSIDYCPYVSHYMQVTAYKPLTENLLLL